MLDKQILYISTPLTMKWKNHCYTASGFFFQYSSPIEEKKLSNYWLVTNRHAIYAEDKENQKHYLMDSITFKIRCEKKESQDIVWFEITMSKDEIQAYTKVLSNYNIDIAVIDICEKVNQFIKESPDNLILYALPITEQEFPNNNKFPIEVCDDIAVIGYPSGFYDEKNLFPIVKNGTIASMWGANFRGRQGFAIDAKLFPGSSGSLVITKPRREDLDDNGRLIFKKEKVFYCLGVFSGEPIFTKRIIDNEGKPTSINNSFNLGFVWYASLITDTIENGEIPIIEY